MRKTLATVALVLALCCPAFAGIMHAPVKSESEPPRAEAPTADGEITNPPLVELVLSLFALL